MSEFKPVKFKKESFYKNAKNFNRSEYVKEFHRLKGMLSRRVNKLTNYRKPEKYQELLDTYAKSLSNYELYDEVRHLYYILRKPERFSQKAIDERREELLNKFSKYGVTNENYDMFFDFLDDVAKIMKECQYSSDEAIEYFEKNLSGEENPDDIDTVIVAREFKAYIEVK